MSRKKQRPNNLDGQELLDWIHSQCRRKRRPWGWVYKRQKLDDCLIWKGGKDNDGYGITSHLGRCVRLHRLVFFLSTGIRIPKGRMLRHKCDRPDCINMNHLEVGSAKDNAVDRAARKRSNQRGERNNNAKLSDFQVRRIKQMYATGKYTQEQLATRFGVSRSYISLVVNEKLRVTREI